MSVWILSIRHLVSLIRFKPFDISTAEGRSRERFRRVMLTALASAFAKGVAFLKTLLSVSLTVRYLGLERYGVWMTISSFVVVLQFADLGLGNGLLNALSEANGRDDRRMALEYVSSGFLMLSIIAVVLVIALAITYPYIPWQRFFNVSSVLAVAEAGPAMAVFIGCFVLSIPLGAVQRIRLGYQEGFVNSVLEAVGCLVGLVGILLVVTLKAGLPWLVLAVMGSMVLASLANGALVFGVERPWLRPNFDYVAPKAIQRMLKTGFLFFALQLVVAMAFASDSVVIAQILGATAVTLYAVPMKLFQMLDMGVQMLQNPLWPAYGEAVTRKDMRWVRKTLLNSLILSLLLSSVGSCILVMFGGRLVRVWAGPDIVVSFELLLGFGIWTVLKAAGNAIAVFLNGINALKFQVLVAILMGISALILKIVLTRVIGLSGAIWATVIAYSVCVAIPMGIYVPRLLRGKLLFEG